MNRNEFIKELNNLNIFYNDDSLNKLEIYKEFLKEYNTHTNLTAIKDDEGIYLKHFYDSLTTTKAINLNNINNLLDIGTGAGFPGMVLKIFYPHLDVYLLDSNNKKTKFLNELKDKLKIDVHIINDRCENYAKNNLNTFDLVISRAVSNMRILSELSLPLVKVNGLFVALKGNVEEELKDAKSTILALNGEIINNIEFNLYKEEGIRNIVVIKKLQETNKDILRSYDKIVKKPLAK